MKPGEVFVAGESITSANGRYAFVYQADGNLVLYGPGGAPCSERRNFHPPECLRLLHCMIH